MPEQSDLDRRLRAVERALTDGDHDVTALQDAAATVERVEELESRLTDLEERLAELEAATQAVRGYVGNVRSVNDEIEQRADAALAAVDRLEARLDERSHADQKRTSPARRRTANRNDQSVQDFAGARRADTGESLGIEMPQPGSETGASTASDGVEDDDRSVIERVREAL